MSWTAVVVELEPAAELDGYEDIVEVSFESEAGSVSLHEWGGENVHAIPELPAGPGRYRLRYLAHGMDRGHDGGEDGQAPGRYLLQIWPANEADPAVVKSTSSMHRYWVTAGYRPDEGERDERGDSGLALRCGRAAGEEHRGA